MAVSKYIEEVAGQLQEGTPKQAGGAGSEEKIIASDAAGLLAASFLPVGVGVEAVNVVTSENLAAGDLVNLHLDGGVIKARKADATTAGKEADGFVTGAVTAPSATDVFLEGRNTAVATTMTLGARQFLSTTAGQVTETAPSATGNVVQIVGRAYATGAMTTENFSGVTVVKA